MKGQSKSLNINARFDMNPDWADTGDRYLLKLFRDYVFHQVDETGAPLLEMSHVIQCLNKVIFRQPDISLMWGLMNALCLLLETTDCV